MLGWSTMAAVLLQNFPFTNGSDVYTTDQGINIVFGLVETLGGDDSITGQGPVFGGSIGDGINLVAVTIDMGTGNDTLTGSGGSNGIVNFGSITMGAGNDAVTGRSSSGGFGISNFGKILTGAGNDTITASSSSGNLLGLINSGTIDTASGNDSITANAIAARVDSKIFGIVNSGVNSMISMGAGNDSLTGSSSRAGSGISNGGTISMGAGANSITGIGAGSGFSTGISNYSGGSFDGGRIITGAGPDSITGSGRTGISNSGTISTAGGNDNITGTGSDAAAIGYGVFNGVGSTIDMGAGHDILKGSILGGGTGIVNDGTIAMGGGNDTVDALTGGFIADRSSEGVVNLGGGKDLLKGFGNGTFIGGEGIDRIVFSEATYTITTSGSGFSIRSSKSPSSLVQMKVSEFERIGANSLSLVAGTCTINSAGNAAYAIL
jgi:hypothetical protein